MFDAELDKMVELLRKNPYTAKALAKKLKVCKQTVYSRLDALKARGYSLVSEAVREGASGPLATAYRVLKVMP